MNINNEKSKTIKESIRLLMQAWENISNKTKAKPELKELLSCFDNLYKLFYFGE